VAVCLVLGCCLGAACDRATEKAPPATPIEPHDLFSRRAPAPPQPAVRQLLLIGDSLSISLGEQLERSLAGAPGLDFIRDGTRSTGLTRPELLDWPRHLRELTRQHPPDIAVIMLGANDVMPVEGSQGNHVQFADPAWAKAYAAKARELTAICRQANGRVSLYWVGVPTMADPALAAGVAQVNAALRAMCQEDGCRFIDTHRAFADENGRFTRQARDAATGELVTIRTADGVHLTENGSRLLAGQVLDVLARREHLPAWAGVDELLARFRDLRTVEDLPPPPAKSVAGKHGKTDFHTIKSGDTLAIVARRYGVASKDLELLNPGVDWRRLSVGQKLRVPRGR
jgi:hypothetical protein